MAAGIYRGDCSLQQVLSVAVNAIADWAARDTTDNDNNNQKPKNSDNVDATAQKEQQQTRLSNVYMFGYTDEECETLQRICDAKFSR